MGQVAAHEALTNGLEEKDRMIESYNQRRRLVVKGSEILVWNVMSRKALFMRFQVLLHRINFRRICTTALI